MRQHFRRERFARSARTGEEGADAKTATAGIAETPLLVDRGAMPELTRQLVKRSQ